MRHLSRTVRGFGDYEVGSNSILTGGMSPPMITNSVTNGGVIVRHREYLRDILPSNPFAITTFSLNPGITGTFPWLSQIANSFEQYRFRGLIFEFKTLSADNVLSMSASTSLGSVVLGTKYNVLDSPFDNKFEMENWEFSNSAKPSKSCIHPIECAKSQTPQSMLYVRDRPPPANADLRLYDLANFNIATVGMQNIGGSDPSGSIGELWCSYEIEFYKPKLTEDIDTSFAHFNNFATDINGVLIGTPFSGHPYGNVGLGTTQGFYFPGKLTNSKLPAFVDVGAQILHITDSIAKTLIISLNWLWSDNIVPLSGTTNIKYVPFADSSYTILSVWGNDASPRFATFEQPSPAGMPNPTTAGTFVTCQFVIKCLTDDVQIPFTGFSYTGNGVSNWDFWISELGPNPL